MDRKSDNHRSGTELWHSCKHGTACSHGSWNGPRQSLDPVAEYKAANKKIEGTEEVLFALALAVEQRDVHTGAHCERLALISVSMGLAMGLDINDLLVLYRGGYLHDIGKIGIPDSILFKRGRLTEGEWETMKTHSAKGEEICQHLKSLKPVLPLIRHHHERWDGSGYPDGLSGERIPVLARVLQLADIYDALISPRPYKEPLSQEEALRVIQEEADRGWRDPDLVRVFMSLHKDVISKVSDYTCGPNRSLTAMQNSISGLQNFLSMAIA